MPTITYTSSNNFNGLSVTGSRTSSVTGICQQEVSLPSGESGEVETLNTLGTTDFTMSTTTGIGLTDTVDVVWNDAENIRTGLTVESASGTDIGLSGGSGDTLPAAGTDVIISPKIDITDTIPGEQLDIISAAFSGDARVDFVASESSVADYNLSANTPFQWFSGNGYDNPLGTSNIDTISVTNHTASANTFKFGCGYNSTED